MLVQNLTFFVILVATSFAHTADQASFWNQRVFPDDENWMPYPIKSKLANSEEETNDIIDYSVCETRDCKALAAEFLRSINKSADPCNNFYDFACGRWASQNTIPSYMPNWSRFHIFQNVVDKRIKDILETQPESSDLLPVRQAKKWYRSCMDTKTLERRGIKPIESVLMRIGGWPIAMDEDEWHAEENSWQTVDRYYAQLTGSHAFFNIRAVPFLNETIEYGRIMIGYQNLPLSEQLPLKYRNYTGNDYVEYVNLVTRVTKMFIERNHAAVSEEKVIQEAKEIVEFEKKLYELQEMGATYDEVHLDEFIDWYEENVTAGIDNPKGEIKWGQLLQELFDTVNIKLHPRTELGIVEMPYVQGLPALLVETPERTIVNYIHWHFIGNMMMYTNEAMADGLFDFVSEEYGIKSRPPRWKECVRDVKMTHASAYAFVKKYYKRDTENAAIKMVKNIKIAMGDAIEKSNWLDEESKIVANDKLSSMRIFLGFPDWYNDMKQLLKRYKGLNIGADYFDNSLSYKRFAMKKNLRAYLIHVETDDVWFMDPITVNAMYGPEDNLINIPAVDFQPPLFTPSLPDNVNYGVAGAVIGHEMGHAFDDQGIQFGKDGNETTLSKKMLKNYYRRANCFTDQFREYYGETPFPDDTTLSPWRKMLRSPSLRTRGENIADTTGLQAVFEAYKKLPKPEMKLPGLEEFTNDQMFFISFGQCWCEVATPEYEAKKNELMDSHSPGKLRVIGAVSNTDAFAKVFNCPASSPMNPENKCDIWKKSETGVDEDFIKMLRNHNRWEQRWKN